MAVSSLCRSGSLSKLTSKSTDYVKELVKATSFSPKATLFMLNVKVHDRTIKVLVHDFASN